MSVSCVWSIAIPASGNRITSELVKFFSVAYVPFTDNGIVTLNESDLLILNVFKDACFVYSDDETAKVLQDIISAIKCGGDVKINTVY